MRASRETTELSYLPDNSVVRDMWHVVGHMSVLLREGTTKTHLLGAEIVITARSEDDVEVATTHEELGKKDLRPTVIRFGFLWTSLGNPARDIFEIEESEDPDRRNFLGAIVGVHVSAPRAIENFLDMAHFPFVHSNTLGTEEQTGVMPYKVEANADGSEIWARECSFYQPVAAATSDKADVVNYVYRVPHPFCSILYKTNPLQKDRNDIIGLFLQPTSEDSVIAFFYLSLLDDSNSDADIRRFQQGILAQDKPILENQVPRKLPLNPRAEISIPADAMSNLYRKWLLERDIRYGTERDRGRPVEHDPEGADSWFPVASTDDLVGGHIFQGELFGQELAIWRAGDGTINVWENRCPHRGVRLSIGQTGGCLLRCRYHGLVFESGDGQCVKVPAHPDRSPSRGLRVKAYPHQVHAGHVWTTLRQPARDWETVELPKLCAVLRARPVGIPAARLALCLEGASKPFRIQRRGSLSFEMAYDREGSEAFLWIQPAGFDHSILRGVLVGSLEGEERLSALRKFNEQLNFLSESAGGLA